MHKYFPCIYVCAPYMRYLLSQKRSAGTEVTDDYEVHVWVLGIELWSSGRTVGALNC